MGLLTAQEISEAVSSFVDKQDKDALGTEFDKQIDGVTRHLLQVGSCGSVFRLWCIYPSFLV